MGKMKEINAMLQEGTSIHDLAEYLQKNNRSISRKQAIESAYKFIQQWREMHESNNDS